MNILQMPATIVKNTDLSKTAKEIVLSLPQPLNFVAGSFVNVFWEKEGKKIRRAYSISSSEENQKEISLSIRNGGVGSGSQLFWQEESTRTPLTIMGPLGLNTADRIFAKRVFLICFGIGVSVIKGILPYILARKSVEEVWVITGSRTEDEILYKDFFEDIEKKDVRLHTRFIVSKPVAVAYPYIGHVQDFISDLEFTDSCVYLCGQKIACEGVQETIAREGQKPSQVLVEAFD